MKTPIVYTLASILYFLYLPAARAQSAVQQFQANYVSANSTISNYTAYPNNPGTFAACATTQYSYTWSNGTANQLKLSSFTANSKTYVVAGIPNVQVKLRRVNNSSVTGERTILYSESTTAVNACGSPRTLNFKAPYSHNMAAFLNNNVLNHGTDNLFTNSGNGDGNINNIERVDVIFPTGIASSIVTDAGFVLCERGANNAHDGFRIAAILSLDGNGNPASFGQVKTCVAGNGSNNGSWGHPSLANGNRQLSAYVLRKDQNEPYLKVSSNITQELGAVFFSLADLGVAANQRIYGYALLSLDGIASPTSAQLLNLSNSSVYPLNTTESAGGGLDLISVNTFFGTNQALASSYVSMINGSVMQHEGIINWKINHPQQGIQVSLERSRNGIDFTTIHSYIHNGSGEEKTLRDIPGKGKYFYRIRIQAGSGFEYSKIIVLDFNQAGNYSLSPSISRAGAEIILKHREDGQHFLRIYNSAGILVANLPATIRGGTVALTLPATIKNGIHMCILQKPGNPDTGVQKILIRN